MKNDERKSYNEAIKNYDEDPLQLHYLISAATARYVVEETVDFDLLDLLNKDQIQELTENIYWFTFDLSVEKDYTREELDEKAIDYGHSKLEEIILKIEEPYYIEN